MMLSVEALKIRYGEVEAVRRVDLAVDSGEIIALVGANGAGKSSTLGAIAGLVPAASGRVVFDGVDITGLAPEAIARKGVALVPEGRRIFASLTVADNLRLGGAVHLSAVEATAREEEMLELFPILRRYHRVKGGNLSGGEQQMLAIARALMSKPRMVLLDEPSLGLAPQLIDTVFDLIAELRRNGLTILLVEQNVALALEIADRAIVLANGEVVLSGTARGARQLGPCPPSLSRSLNHDRAADHQCGEPRRRLCAAGAWAGDRLFHRRPDQLRPWRADDAVGLCLACRAGVRPAVSAGRACRRRLAARLPRSPWSASPSGRCAAPASPACC